MKKLPLKKGFTKTSFVYILVILIFSVLVFVLFNDRLDSVRKDRDAIRIDDINTIRYALDKYYKKYGEYPACLYNMKGCASLEGSFAMTVAPLDPLTSDRYSYAGIKAGSKCGSYHLGISLERTGSQALLTGADAPPSPNADLCTGSSPDFSGLSYAPGGEPCDAKVGIPQPTDSMHGETCYDIEP